MEVRVTLVPTPDVPRRLGRLAAVLLAAADAKSGACLVRSTFCTEKIEAGNQDVGKVERTP